VLDYLSVSSRSDGFAAAGSGLGIAEEDPPVRCGQGQEAGDQEMLTEGPARIPRLWSSLPQRDQPTRPCCCISKMRGSIAGPWDCSSWERSAMNWAC